MTHSVWRIGTDTPAYQSDDLTGAGAKLSGGRWNAVGVPLIYTSTSRALACLETVVHLNSGGLPLNRYLVEVRIPDDIWNAARRETAATLPVGWDAEPAGQASIELGTRWVASGTTAILMVASVIVPEEFNVLINPSMRGSIGAAKIRKWLYDPRLKPGR